MTNRCSPGSRNDSSSANRQRGLVAVVQMLGLSVWFSATAVVPSLRAEWGLGPAAAGWLTASVQIGFAAGAVGSAVLNLADRVRPPHLLAVRSGCAAMCTAGLAFSPMVSGRRSRCDWPPGSRWRVSIRWE